MLDFQSKSVNEVWKQACRSYERGMLYDAYLALEQVLSRQPEFGLAWELLGLVYHNWRQWGPSAAALEEASVRESISLIGDRALADCYRVIGRPNWAVGLQ